mmetsp:Transcript_23680/g.66610  ORF Transcript_23680/g.66610 Transcript_23680/m.66610 type:complete len:258 (+) Transcript_23680:474-1247(+)
MDLNHSICSIRLQDIQKRHGLRLALKMLQGTNSILSIDPASFGEHHQNAIILFGLAKTFQYVNGIGQKLARRRRIHGSDVVLHGVGNSNGSADMFAIIIVIILFFFVVIFEILIRPHHLWRFLWRKTQYPGHFSFQASPYGRTRRHHLHSTKRHACRCRGHNGGRLFVPILPRLCRGTSTCLLNAQETIHFIQHDPPGVLQHFHRFRFGRGTRWHFTIPIETVHDSLGGSNKESSFGGSSISLLFQSPTKLFFSTIP